MSSIGQIPLPKISPTVCEEPPPLLPPLERGPNVATRAVSSVTSVSVRDAVVTPSLQYLNLYPESGMAFTVLALPPSNTLWTVVP